MISVPGLLHGIRGRAVDYFVATIYLMSTSLAGKTAMITWDERKRVYNLAKHGIDFAVIEDDFFDDAVILPAHSRRLQAIGWLDGHQIVVVIFKPLGSEAVSLISARRANKKERAIING